MDPADCPDVALGATDTDLVRRFCAGDKAVFAGLVRRHQAKLVRLAGRIVGGPEDAEDVVQEAIIVAYQQMPRFRAESSFGTWLGRIVVYKALRVARRRGRTVPGDCSDLPDQSRGLDAPAAERVRAAVGRLPDKLRLPVVLRFYEDLSGQEIACILGWKQSTVWTRLYRGLERLKGELQGVELP